MSERHSGHDDELLDLNHCEMNLSGHGNIDPNVVTYLV